MKAMFRIVTPAAATAAAALLLTACADKPVRIPGGAFVDEPYQGETDSRTQTIPSNASDTMETEIIYIDDDVPVGPVENKGPKSGSTTVQPGTQLQPVDRQPASTAKSSAPEGSVEYKVVKGDTLWGIGMVYGVSVDRLAEINGISKNSTLKIGQILMIPPDAKNAVGKPIPQKKTEPATSTPASTSKPASSSSTKTQPVAKDGETLYVVKKGDSLSVIAQRHHVKLADLVAANKLDPKGILRIGQTLVIPAGGTAAASSASATKSGSATASTTKPASAAATTKPATASTTATTAKTDPATASTSKPATASQSRGGETTGGIVEPIGGSSFGGASSSTSAPATASTTKPASSNVLSSFDPVFAVPDADTITISTESEATIEEIAKIHERDLQALIQLNPAYKPGQKIPAGTPIKMPIY